ncbi:MAG: GH25 family lysozyme [Ruminococcus sp.]|nr:GH25 family lysozyme [Ruminococcus sp.]
MIDKKKTIVLALGAVMTAAAVGVSALLSTAVVNRKRYPVFGVDVSNYQGEVDWERLGEQGVQFAFIKATEGSGHVDESARRNIESSAQTDIKRSCYHFFSFDSSGHTQAQNFISVVGRDDIDLPPVVDIEYYGDKAFSKPTRGEAEEVLLPLLDELELYYGTKPLIYTTMPVYLRYVKPICGDGYPLWIRCKQTEPDFVDWTFWQYDDHGELDGYYGDEKYIDFNVFCGSSDEFEDFAADWRSR